MKPFSEPSRSDPGRASKRAVDPLEWIEPRNATDILAAMARQVRRRRGRRLQAAAGGVAGFLLLALVWTRSAHGPVAPSSAVVHAPEVRVLADGTVVQLRPGAVIALAYTAAQRRVALTRGEAHFQVAKNAARPFIVEVGAVEFRAVGTAFSLERKETKVELLVTEGRVAIDEHSGAGAPQVTGLAPSSSTLTTLGAGARTEVSLRSTAATVPEVQLLAPAEMSARQAWRVPRLEFSGTPLREAIPIINAYSRVQLVLADEALAAVRVSGTLRADNLETLRELLAEAYGIRSEYRGETEIVLSKTK